MGKWVVEQMASQAGRRFVITGGNSGVGFQAALALVRKGAEVVLACRDKARGEAAGLRLQGEAGGGRAVVEELDLASLDSVRRFAEHELARGRELHGLINNAGVMAPKLRRETVDGFELQFGTNVLGHFALTGLLLPALERAGAGARVVTLASIAHKKGRLNFEDLQAVRSYSPMRAYQQSKLADLMFAFELQRRLRAAGSRVLSVAAHPGVANTNLFQVGEFSSVEKVIRRWAGVAIGALLNSEAEGGLPTLFAAVAPEAEGGGYYGPTGLGEMRGGDVGAAVVAPLARDEVAARRLWTVCEDLTGVRFL